MRPGGLSTEAACKALHARSKCAKAPTCCVDQEKPEGRLRWRPKEAPPPAAWPSPSVMDWMAGRFSSSRARCRCLPRPRAAAAASAPRSLPTSMKCSRRWSPSNRWACWPPGGRAFMPDSWRASALAGAAPPAAAAATRSSVAAAGPSKDVAKVEWGGAGPSAAGGSSSACSRLRAGGAAGRRHATQRAQRRRKLLPPLLAANIKGAQLHRLHAGRTVCWHM